MSDLEDFTVDARNDEEAVAKFSGQLGVNLTLEEGPAVPEYMMGRIPSDARWAKPEDIPVYEVP